MTQLLIQGSTILAQGPFVESDDAFQTADQIIPKHVIDGWQVVDAALPDGFTCGGYTWNGAGVDAKPVPAPAVTVPQTVTMRQARLALLGAGKLAAVDAAIASLPSPQREAAQIEWDYSSAVDRNRNFVAMIAPALGLDEAQIDALFIAAAEL